MQKITLPNGEIRELTDEQYEEFEKLFPKKTTAPFRAKSGDMYYVVGDTGIVYEVTDTRHEFADYRFLIGNYYETSKEAEHALEVQKAIGTVTHVILKSNDGFVPNWSDGNQSKYFIAYTHDTKTHESYPCHLIQEAYKLPYIKDRDTAQKIIKDYKKELDLIFGV